MDIFKRKDLGDANEFAQRAAAAKAATQVQARESLAQIRSLLSELEHATRHVDNDNVKTLHTQAALHLNQLQRTLGDAGSRLRDGARKAIDAGDAQIRDRPWQTLGLVSGLALILSVAIFRNRE